MMSSPAFLTTRPAAMLNPIQTFCAFFLLLAWTAARSEAPTEEGSSAMEERMRESMAEREADSRVRSAGEGRKTSSMTTGQN